MTITERQKDGIQKLRNEGKTVRETAKILGISENSVLKYGESISVALASQGFPPVPPPPIEQRPGLPLENHGQIEKLQQQPPQPQQIQQPQRQQPEPLQVSSSDEEFLRDFLKRFSFPDQFISILLRKMRLRSGLLPSASEIRNDIQGWNKNFKNAEFVSSNYSFELENRYPNPGYNQPMAYQQGHPQQQQPYQQQPRYLQEPRYEYESMTQLRTEIAKLRDEQLQDVKSRLTETVTQLINSQGYNQQLRDKLHEAEVSKSHGLSETDVKMAEVQDRYRLETQKRKDEMETKQNWISLGENALQVIPAAIERTVAEMKGEQAPPRPMAEVTCPGCAANLEYPLGSENVKCSECNKVFSPSEVKVEVEQPEEKPEEKEPEIPPKCSICGTRKNLITQETQDGKKIMCRICAGGFEKPSYEPVKVTSVEPPIEPPQQEKMPPQPPPVAPMPPVEPPPKEEPKPTPEPTPVIETKTANPKPKQKSKSKTKSKTRSSKDLLKEM